MIDQFVEMTQGIIRQDGFSDYLPTLVLPQTRQIAVLEAELDGDNHESAVHEWISGRVTSGQDFLVSFKVDAEHFKVFGRIVGQQHERLCRVSED